MSDNLRCWHARAGILFIAGYVNHGLTGHALRLSRLDIPCGYTGRTNVNLVLEDVESCT